MDPVIKKSWSSRLRRADSLASSFVTGSSRSPFPHPDAAISEAERAAIQRRVLRTVMLAQVLGGAGLAAGVTVGALIAADIMGGDELAGLPAALTTLGAAATAYLVGAVARRHGRRLGLGLGFVAGAVGAGGVASRP